MLVEKGKRQWNILQPKKFLTFSKLMKKKKKSTLHRIVLIILHGNSERWFEVWRVVYRKRIGLEHRNLLYSVG